MPNNHSLSAEHRRHDRLLVARFAAGDAAFGQDDEARDLVRRCRECAALAADISAISGAVAKLPAPPRPRDFRLTAVQADNLRGSRLDRWLRTISGSGWATVRPVAAMALSVGMVMSVVGVLPIVGAAAPGGEFDGPPAAAVNQPTPQLPTDRSGSLGPDAPSGNADPVNPEGAGNGEVAQPPANLNIDQAYVDATPDAEPQPGESSDFEKSLPGASSGLGSVLLLGGLAVTFLAFAVLALLYAARRRVYDPLLR